ncbi:MAG TPA: hypothetical protein P5534_18805 [Candidatus Paceibacterota bacterium]|nr:hypothetical protein [Candidatus Paceibacterota bacterium]
MALTLAWLLAWGGYTVAKSRRVTAERVQAFMRTVDLSALTGEARAKALRELASKLNGLSYEERQRARLDQEWARWLLAMTEAEKSEFIEATLPTGFKQMLGAFEQLPVDRRRRTVDEAVKRLKQAREELASGDVPMPEWETNAPPVLSEEVRQKLITTGLKSFYSESSAQTKAEAAPLLEELQHMMEGGGFLRGGR